MAQYSTKVVRCNRCGAVDTLSVDGLLTFVVVDGWLKLSDDHDLCPSCAKGFREFAQSYFEEGQCPEDWRGRL